MDASANDGIAMYDKPEFDQYLQAFYWAVQTITTVGYGDLTIVNKSEKVFCLLVMMIGVICFTFASGSLASIL